MGRAARVRRKGEQGRQGRAGQAQRVLEKPSKSHKGAIQPKLLQTFHPGESAAFTSWSAWLALEPSAHASTKARKT